jgi:hypothetical protein
VVSLLELVPDQEEIAEAAGLALLLGDVQKRMRMILELALSRPNSA